MKDLHKIKCYFLMQNRSLKALANSIMHQDLESEIDVDALKLQGKKKFSQKSGSDFF